jgi:CCR4-NOT transcription complex subunit 1
MSKDLDLKQLLIESSGKRCMNIAMLVTCKVLRTGEKTRLFNSRNPWMVAMYSLLIEYMERYCSNPNYESDKNTEKEIQLVLKNRAAGVVPTRISTLFRDYDEENLNNRELAYIIQKIREEPLIVIPEIPEDAKEEQKDEFLNSQDDVELEIEPSVFNSDVSVSVVEASEKFKEIDENFLTTIAKEALIMAMKEIRDPVIKRVIPITLITTRMLILKDFALEPSPEKLMQAAISLSKSCAGMLAQITCKEPLKHQYARSLKDILIKSGNAAFNQQTDDLKRELIELLIKENLDRGCQEIRNEIQQEA